MEDYIHIVTAFGASAICYWVSRDFDVPLPKIALAYIGGSLVAHEVISVYQKEQPREPLIDHLNAYVGALIVISSLSFLST